MSRPRPVPWPTGLVLKDGSKILSRTSSGMPGPVFRTQVRVVRLLIVAVMPTPRPDTEAARIVTQREERVQPGLRSNTNPVDSVP